MKYFDSESQYQYQNLFDSMQVQPDKIEIIEKTAKIIYPYFDSYKEISICTGVPGAVIGALHLRECNLNFNLHLHNGDSLSIRTVHVPAGRPIDAPMSSFGYTFEESAIDALKFYAKNRGIKLAGADWSIPFMLNFLEGWNGFGYRKHNVNSAYLWSFTNHYEKGGYAADGKWSDDYVSKQIGCAPLLREILKLQGR